MSTGRALAAAYGSRFSLVSCHWPAPLGSLAASLCPCLPLTQLLTLVSTAMCLRCVQALVAGPGPYHSLCVCYWLLALRRHLQLTPTAVCVHTTGPGHHCCLPRSLAAGSGSAAENLNSPCSHCGCPTLLIIDQTVVNAVNACGLR